MKRLFYLTLGLCALTFVSHSQSGTGELLPSEALALMYKAVDENPNKPRLENTKQFAARVITEDLNAQEQFFLGEVYFWNLQPKESKAAYARVLEEDGVIAQAARQRIWIIDINGFGLWDAVEKDLADYMNNVSPSAEDRFGAYFGINFIAGKYQKDGNHQAAVDLINQELSRLNPDAPHLSFLLPSRFMESYQAVGEDQTLIAQLTRIKDGLNKTLDDRESNLPENDFEHTLYCAPVDNMHTAVTEKLGYKQLNTTIEKMIDKLDKFIAEN